MKALVVISGKGGTGKTSLVGAFAALADRPVIADCDVDAPDLHLLLSPQIRERHPFGGGQEARIHEDACLGCGACVEACRFGAISRTAAPAGPDGSGASPEAVRVLSRLRVDPFRCEGCGVCRLVCPFAAVEMVDRIGGEWMISTTRCGPMVHARLRAGGRNSGKLVSIVRREARRLAEESGRALILVDGPPGIGCPVIAAIGGACRVLVVTEPTVAGIHDLARVLSLAKHFSVPASVCVNRWDLNPEMTLRIEADAFALGARIVGRIRYDRVVPRLQLEQKTAAESDSAVADDIRRVWTELEG